MRGVDSQSSSPATPEEYRRRYHELKRTAEAKQQQRPRAAVASNPNPLPSTLVVHEEAIPGGWYWSTKLARGQTLRIVNGEATPGVSMLAWNADDPTERYNAADTVKIQWNAVVTKGRVLFSDMGRVLLSVTDDSCGAHDTLAGGSTVETNARRYGTAQTRATRDNFILAAAKHGLSRRDVPPCITFFAPVRTDSAGGLVWQEGAVKPGDYVDLRAEMNVLVALSNCPHPLAPGKKWAPRPVRAIVWNSPPPAADDLCRTGSDEAVRGFENTDPLFRA
jgi:urea carboxylase-associated protein 2